MTKQSNDEHKEELHISDAPIKERYHSESSSEHHHHSGKGGASSEHHHHHHSRRGHRSHDSRPLDQEAVNEDLHTVIADYWKDRQKPGFVGYKSTKNEDEEIRVIVRDDNDQKHSFVDRITGKVVEELPPTEEEMDSYQDSGSTEDNQEESTVSENPDTDTEEPETDTEEPGTDTGEPGTDTGKADDVSDDRSTIGEGIDSVEIKDDIDKDDIDIEDTNTEETESVQELASPSSETEEAGATEIVVKKKHKKNKKKKGPIRVIKWTSAILLLCLLVGVVTFGFMRYIGWKNTNRTNDSGEDISVLDDAVSEDGGKTVIYKGVTYTYNEELSTVLFIGVDQEEYAEDGVSGEAGQADTVILTVVNQKTGETRMIPISRSTMVAVDQYNTDGSYWKQENVQLAVSYAYGNNIDENCRNVAKSVSRILYGMPVHRFVTMDLSAIPQLNDAVGGVTVDCLEDLTEVNADWTKGAQITLHGKEAETYVRTRKTTITDENQDNNAPRMERQKQYLNNFMYTLLTRMKGDIFVPLRLYRDVGDDIYSDVTTSEIVYYTSMVVSKGFNNSVLSIDGSVKHNEFTEFYPDEEKLYQLILDTFYERQ